MRLTIEAGDGHQQHAGRGHGRRRAKPPDRLPQDVGSDTEQQRAVRKRAQRFEARIAERPPGIRWPASQAYGDQRNDETGRVGRHVCGIRQQRQAVGQQAADDLDDQERAGESQCPPQRLLMPHLAQSVIVSVAHVSCRRSRTRGRCWRRTATPTSPDRSCRCAGSGPRQWAARRPRSTRRAGSAG